MLKIIYSPAALEDLQYIRDYILDLWGEKTAIKALNNILSSIRKLGEFPALGIDLGKMIDVPTDYRYLYIEKNYVFYRLENNTVKIIRIISERQDYIGQLFEIDSEFDKGN